MVLFYTGSWCGWVWPDSSWCTFVLWGPYCVPVLRAQLLSLAWSLWPKLLQFCPKPQVWSLWEKCKHNKQDSSHWILPLSQDWTLAQGTLMRNSCFRAVWQCAGELGTKSDLWKEGKDKEWRDAEKPRELFVCNESCWQVPDVCSQQCLHLTNYIFYGKNCH